MKFDLSDFQSTQIKIPTIQDVCLNNFFEQSNIEGKEIKSYSKKELNK